MNARGDLRDPCRGPISCPFPITSFWLHSLSTSSAAALVLIWPSVSLFCPLAGQKSRPPRKKGEKEKKEKEKRTNHTNSEIVFCWFSIFTPWSLYKFRSLVSCSKAFSKKASHGVGSGRYFAICNIGVFYPLSIMTLAFSHMSFGVTMKFSAYIWRACKWKHRQAEKWTKWRKVVKMRVGRSALEDKHREGNGNYFWTFILFGNIRKDIWHLWAFGL